MSGEVTIKLPRDEHMLLHVSSSGVAGAGRAYQCILCDQKALDAGDFGHLRCIPARIITIKVSED